MIGSVRGSGVLAMMSYSVMGCTVLLSQGGIIAALPSSRYEEPAQRLKMSL